MEKALSRYLSWHRASGHSHKTVTFHKDTISLFIRWCEAHTESTSLDALCPENVREWVAEQMDRNLSDHTVATRVRSLRAWSKWLADEEYIEKDLLTKMKKPKETDTVKPTLDPDEVDRILSRCDRKTELGKRDYAIILLLFSTGLRATELTSLLTEDVDWQQGLITVRRGKGGKFRVVPLGTKVAKALTRYLAGRTDGPLFLTSENEAICYTTLREVLRRRGRDAGVHANPHKFRHTAAIQYLRAGGRVENLRVMLGHSTLDMTLHYARIVGADLVEAHQTADPTKSLKSK